jgi:hypothetical protein
MAYCDQTVPNPFGFIFDSTAPTSPLPVVSQTFGVATGNFQLFYKSNGLMPDLTTCPAPRSGNPLPPTRVPHGFLLDWTDSAITMAAQNQAADFLLNDHAQPSLVVLP